MVTLEDLIPDPSTREFLREVNRCWGREWANTLTREIHGGVLVDMGTVEGIQMGVKSSDREVDGVQLELLGCGESKKAAKAIK